MPQTHLLITFAVALLWFLQAGCIPTPALDAHAEYDKAPGEHAALSIRSADDHPDPHDPFWKQHWGEKFRDGDTLTKGGHAARDVVSKPTVVDTNENQANMQTKKQDTKPKSPLFARFAAAKRLIMGVGGIQGLKFKDVANKTKKPTSVIARFAFYILGPKHKDRPTIKPGPKLESLNPRAASVNDISTTTPVPTPTHYAGWTNPTYNETACAAKQVLAQAGYDAARAACFTPNRPQTATDEECGWAAQRGPLGCCAAIQFTLGMSGRCQRWWPDVADWEGVECCKGNGEKKGTEVVGNGEN